MRRVLVATALLLAAGAASATFAVNLVETRNLGCSTDVFTSPDLQVRVLVDGAQVLAAPEHGGPAGAQGAFVLVDRDRGAEIEVQVWEAEPGGFLGLGTDWVRCDAASGGETSHRARYEGGVQELAASGDGDRAAGFRVVVGAPWASPPRVNASVAATSAALRWDAAPGDHSVLHLGLPLGGVPPGAARADVGGLCDGLEYTFHVRRSSPPWLVDSAPVTFRTPNLPPQPATVTSATVQDGNVTVAWSPRSPHDAARYEVYGGPAGFAVEAATLRATAQPPFFDRTEASFAAREGDAEVLVRTVDTGGLHADSARFAVGAAPRSGEAPSPCEPRLRAQDDPVVVEEEGAPEDERPTPPPDEPELERVEDPAAPPADGGMTPGMAVAFGFVAGALVVGAAVALVARRR